MTRSMGESSQPSSCDLIGSLCVEVVAGVVVVVVVVLLGWNNSSIKAWKCLFVLDPFKATSHQFNNHLNVDMAVVGSGLHIICALLVLAQDSDPEVLDEILQVLPSFPV